MNQSHRKHTLHLSVKVVTFLTYLGTSGNHLFNVSCKQSLHTNGFRYSPITLAASYVPVSAWFTIGLNFNFSTVTLSISLKLEGLAVAYKLAG